MVAADEEGRVDDGAELGVVEGVMTVADVEEFVGTTPVGNTDAAEEEVAGNDVDDTDGPKIEPTRELTALPTLSTTEEIGARKSGAFGVHRLPRSNTSCPLDTRPTQIPVNETFAVRVVFVLRIVSSV